MSTSSQLGWEEWLALPELGLPAIKAKVDTGARTSALHAFQIEPFGPPEAPMVRFGIHPVPGREEIEVYCSARVIDRRQVRSSNGRRESRYVISTTVKMGRRSWPIEVTLTNRENMAYRMLLGRKAIPEDMIVDPGTSFLQPRLSYRLYSDVPRSITVRRSLRIALLTTRPNTTTSVRLRAAGEEAGHVVEVLDPMRLSLVVDADRPALLLDGNLLPHFDAVVARLGQRPSAFGTAIVRQLEMLGSFLVNPAQALGIARDRLQQHQLLAASGVRNPALAVTQTRKSTRRIADLVGGPPVVVRRGSGSATDAGVLARTRRSMDMALSTLGGREDEYLIERSVDDVSGERVHNVVIGTKVAASLADRTSSLSEGSRPRVPKRVRLQPEERRLVLRAARALKLRFAGIELARTEHGPTIVAITTAPRIGAAELATGKDLAGQVIALIESRVPTIVHRQGADRGAGATSRSASEEPAKRS